MYIATSLNLQFEVNMSMRESFDTVPVQFYNLRYRQSRGLVTQISNMQNDVSMLLQTVKPATEGTMWKLI